MFRLTMLVAAMSFTALGARAQEPPVLPPDLAVLAQDAAAARSFDYMALKASGADLEALTSAVWVRTKPGEDRIRRCPSPAEAELILGLSAAQAAADAEAFAADRAAAEAAWARWDAFVETVRAGATTDGPVAAPPWSYAAERFARAGEATDRRARELTLRTASDQLHRHAFSAGAEIWGPLGPGAAKLVETRLTMRMCEIDTENTAWLKSDVAANGWPGISAVGEKTAGDAWLLVQHADNDPAFQAQMLALMEPLAAAGEVSRSNFAYLYDRVAGAENRPQRYGTQGRCVAKGRWEPNPLEDPDTVEALREAADIGSLVEYQAHMHRYCGDFSG